MSKLMRLLMVLTVALVLTACGAPAYVNDAGHAEEGDHAADTDHAEDAEHTEEGEAAAEDADHAADADHADEGEAAAEGDHADEGEASEEDAAGAEDHSAGEDHSDAAAEGESAVSVGDAANGEVLFNTLYTEVGFACATCHNVDSEERLIGPGLLNIATHTHDRVEGLTTEEYIYQSITEPNAYVVPDYPENLMPQVYTEIFTEDQIADIMAYVLTLEG